MSDTFDRFQFGFFEDPLKYGDPPGVVYSAFKHRSMDRRTRDHTLLTPYETRQRDF